MFSRHQPEKIPPPFWRFQSLLGSPNETSPMRLDELPPSWKFYMLNMPPIKEQVSKKHRKLLGKSKDFLRNFKFARLAFIYMFVWILFWVETSFHLQNGISWRWRWKQRSTLSPAELDFPPFLKFSNHSCSWQVKFLPSMPAPLGPCCNTWQSV